MVIFEFDHGEVNVFLGKGKYIFRITFDDKGNPNDPKNEIHYRVNNQILNTFRFIELNKETSNWYTYRNENYGFELKIPPNWERIGDNEFRNKNNINNSLEIRAPLESAGSAFINISFDEDILLDNDILAKKKVELNQINDYKWQRVIIQWKYKGGGVLIYDYPYGEDATYYINLFNKILSTFHFL